ncbi:MAG: hypothetical protein ACK5MT_13030 [Actinomycetales bacterium]
MPSIARTRSRLAGTLAAAVTAVGLLGAPAHAASGELTSDQRLYEGQELVSPNGQHHLLVGEYVIGGALQIVGNSCIPTYLVGPETTPPDLALVMQSDGNLVLYNGFGPMWSTGTQGHPGAFARLQDDMNLVVYSAAGQPLWWSGSVCDQDYNSDAVIGDQMETEFGVGHFMQSANGRYRLIVQADGNLVLYSPSRAIWWTGTSGGGAHLNHQTDNNVVLYNASGRALWSTRTGSTNASDNWYHRSVLALQDDGNLVLYKESDTTASGYRAVWSSGTAGRS